MKGMRFKFWIGSLLVAGAGLVAVILWSNSRVGRVLDSYRGVPVYDNGLLYFRSYGKNYNKTLSVERAGNSPSSPATGIIL